MSSSITGLRGSKWNAFNRTERNRYVATSSQQGATTTGLQSSPATSLVISREIAAADKQLATVNESVARLTSANSTFSSVKGKFTEIRSLVDQAKTDSANRQTLTARANTLLGEAKTMMANASSGGRKVFRSAEPEAVVPSVEAGGQGMRVDLNRERDVSVMMQSTSPTPPTSTTPPPSTPPTSTGTVAVDREKQGGLEGSIEVAFGQAGAVYELSGGGLTDTLVKRSADGLVEWSKTLESQRDWYSKGTGQIAVANDGGVFVAREVGGTGDNNSIMLEKYNSDGTIAFSREVSPAQVFTNETRVTDLKVDAEGSLYASLTFSDVTGQNGPVKADSVAQIVKFNAQGTELWRRSIESDQKDYSGELAIGKDGEIYMVGVTDGVLPGTDGSGGVGGRDIFLARFEKDGTRSWLKQFGENIDQAFSVAVDNSGAVYVSGKTFQGTGFAGQAYSAGKNVAGILTKFSSSGERIWNRMFDNEWDPNFASVATSSDGGIFVNTSDEKTANLIRFGSDGTQQYKTTYQTGGDSNKPIRAKSIAIAADRSVYLGVKTGIWNGEVRDQTRLLKFSADSGGGTQPSTTSTSSSSSSTSSTTQMSPVTKRVDPLNYQTINLTSDEGVTNAAAYVDAVLSDIDKRTKDVSAGITTATGVASYVMTNRNQKAQQALVAQPVIYSSSSPLLGGTVSGSGVYVPTLGSSGESSKKQYSMVQQFLNSRRRYIA